MNATSEGARNRAPDPATIRTIIFGIMLAMFLSALDQTIVATALPTIGRVLSDVDDLSWVVTAYLLTATAVTPLYGKLSDTHGRRTMLLIGIGVFILGSVAGALAPTMPALIVARAVQGLGGGGLISLAQTIIADVVSPLERGRYQGLIGAVFAVASIGGPVLGGFFAEHLHWSLIFWINVPLGLLALQMTNRALKQLPRHDRPRRLDFIGAGLMMLATVALLLALSWGGKVYTWNSPQIIGLLLLSAVMWAAFVLRLLTAREPFLPLAVLLNPVVGVGIASVSCVFGTMIGLSIFVPLYFELVLGLSASGSGLALMALMGGVVVGSTTTGRLMPLIQHYKRLPYIGLTIAILAFAPLAMRPSGQTVPIVAILLGMIGLGIGSLFPITTVSIQNAVSPHQLGTATGAMNFCRSLGGAILVAAFGAIVFGGGAAGPQGATPNSQAGQPDRFGPELANMFGWVFVAAAICLAVGLCCLLAMEERPLRGWREPKVPVAAE